MKYTLEVMEKLITLLPNSKRLKQLISEHGNQWKVLRSGFPPCFNGTKGFWITTMIGPIHQRWVRQEDVENA